MICIRCHKDVPDAPYCCLCGSSQQSAPRRVKSRGNGQGSVYRLPNGKYRAVKTVGYYLDDDGKKHRKAVTKQFTRRRDAVNAVPLLGIGAAAEKSRAQDQRHF